MTDIDQALIGSKVGRVQDRQVVHPLPTYTLSNKTRSTFMLMTFSFIFMTQMIDMLDFYFLTNRTMFHMPECETNEFYHDFIMDKDYRDKDLQHYFLLQKNVVSLHLNTMLFRSGKFFLENARERIKERRLNRATEETRFIPAKKDGKGYGPTARMA